MTRLRPAAFGPLEPDQHRHDEHQQHARYQPIHILPLCFAEFIIWSSCYRGVTGTCEVGREREPRPVRPKRNLRRDAARAAREARVPGEVFRLGLITWTPA